MKQYNTKKIDYLSGNQACLMETQRTPDHFHVFILHMLVVWVNLNI